MPGMRPTRFELIVVALLLVVQAPGLLRLAEVWSEVEYASHGFLVPLVAIWAATAHRDTLARLAAQPASSGFVLLGLVSVLSLAALLFGNPTLIGVGLVASVWVAVLALRGRAWVETLIFPLGYLLFMIPLPLAWVAPLIVQLQLFVSTLAVGLLRAAGIAILREGNVLTLPGDVSLFVAEACSGITSLITLLPIGVFVAYFTEFELRRRLVIVLAVVPIALAGNLLRVILTVFLAMYVDVEYATQGPLHEWAGVATYVIGCLCLLAVGRVMRAFWPEPSPQPA
ncbi:MAG: exosortase/archaeosortase family protein [Deltaproteobacteria bacterium]|nr:exosortase/archaeosortase family protein [Deltaproteobacteria bacterium]